jgi:hypothetical protein
MFQTSTGITWGIVSLHWCAVFVVVLRAVVQVSLYYPTFSQRKNSKTCVA